MPPISTLTTSEEQPTTNNDESPTNDTQKTAAFQIINEEDTTSELHPQQNSLTASLSVIKPLPTRDQQSVNATRPEKPNVIVYPTRRILPQNGNLEEQRQKNFTRSNGYISSVAARNIHTNLQKNYSSSHGNLITSTKHPPRNPKPPRDDINTPDSNPINEFTKKLDAKLRRLQDQERSVQNKSKQESRDENRKPFITVVKKGTFIRPPPNIAQKLLLEPEPEDAGRNEKVHIAKKLYAYASRPKILNRTSTTTNGDDTINGTNGTNGPANKYSGGKRNMDVSEKNMHKMKCDAAANVANLTAGVTRVRREANGEWKIQNNDAGHGNIMYDKRIIRGNTYALPPQPTPPKWNPNFGNARTLTRCGGDEETLAARAAEARRRAMCRKKVRDRKAYELRLRLGSPPPVPGRKHEPVQTELYLEELFEHPDMIDTTTQTDLFLDRPKSPFYYPAKVGIDAATQIYPGELFDFDIEVQPILEVLVGKTIEQSLIEVLEEEELEALREQQRRFEEIRNAECAEAQRLEEREKRYEQEKDRRVEEHIRGEQAQRETEERIAAAVLLQGYIADMLPSVLTGLKDDGFLVDSMKAEVDDNFMPWLMKEVTNEMESMVSSRDVLMDIVKDILEKRHETYKILGETEEPEDSLLSSAVDTELPEEGEEEEEEEAAEKTKEDENDKTKTEKEIEK